MADNDMKPADIYRQLTEHADQVLIDSLNRRNLDIILDYHWIYLHAKDFKEHNNIGKFIGKWKCDVLSDAELLAQVQKLLPFIALGLMPVCKFTNFANAPHARKIIAIYCYAEEGKAEIEQVLAENSIPARWGGDKHRRP